MAPPPAKFALARPPPLPPAPPRPADLLFVAPAFVRGGALSWAILGVEAADLAGAALFAAALGAGVLLGAADAATGEGSACAGAGDDRGGLMRSVCCGAGGGCSGGGLV